MKTTFTSNLLLQTILTTRRITYLTVGAMDKLLGRKPGNVILAYHNIGSSTDRFTIPMETFEKQLKYLSQHYHFISCQDLLLYLTKNKPLPTPWALLTFDDGFESLVNLIPLVKKYQIAPVVFAISHPSRVNRKELGSTAGLLSDEGLKQLHQSGWVIGCHSATHADFSKLSPKQHYQEIVSAKQHLEKRLGKPVTVFAFPKGVYTNEIITLLKESGYALGFSMDDTLIKQSASFFTLPRVGIDRTHSFEEFKATVSPSLIMLRGWLKKTPIGKII